MFGDSALYKSDLLVSCERLLIMWGRCLGDAAFDVIPRLTRALYWNAFAEKKCLVYVLRGLRLNQGSLSFCFDALGATLEQGRFYLLNI